MARTKVTALKSVKRSVKSVPVDPTKSKKPRRHKPGTVALREIKKQQKSTALSLPKSVIARLVKEYAQNAKLGEKILVGKDAVEALHIASEDLLTELLTEANDVAVKLRGQKTLDVESFRHVYKTSSNSPKCLRENKVVPIPDT